MTDPVDVPDPHDPDARPVPAAAPDAPVDSPSETHVDSQLPTGAREAAAAICPYLASSGGSWRMAMPSREHRCIALTPPTPQTTDKQRRHCLTAAHVECSIYRATREARQTSLAAGADPARIAAADEARRPLPRTAPILLEPPRLVDQATRLRFDRAPGQLALVALMVVAFAVLALSRLTGGSSAGPSAQPSAVAVAPSRALPTPTAVPTVEPSAPEPSGPTASASPSFRTTYTVRKGDTLVGVASRFKTTVAAIRALNKLKTSTLHVGQVLKIP